MQIRDEIYAYEWTNYFDNNCNSFYIGGNVHALIDPGLSRYVPELLTRMEHEGIATQSIKYVINTHSHPDHFEGSAYFYGREVKIGMHEEELSFLRGSGGELYSLFGLEQPIPQINLVLSEGELVLGDEIFQVLHVPGHSPGSVALYSPSRGALFSGDVVFDQSIGRTDFPGGNGKLLKESIEKLACLDAAYLLPGHMGMIDGRQQVKQNFEMILEYFAPYL